MTSVQCVLDQPVCSMLAGLTHSSCVGLCMCISFFVITHRFTVLSILISNLINKYNSLTLARPKHALHAPSIPKFGLERGNLKGWLKLSAN